MGMEVTSLSRLPYWEEALSLYLDRCHDTQFKWGEHDCALFAAGAVKAMCGVDPAETMRGTYSDARGAAEALKEKAAGTLLKTANAWFGEHKHPAQAKRGDIVAKDRTTLGVCVGHWSWFVGEEGSHQGLIAIPTADCKKAWTVSFVAEVTDE